MKKFLQILNFFPLYLAYLKQNIYTIFIFIVIMIMKIRFLKSKNNHLIVLQYLLVA
jgi:hypothetical protein